MKYAGVDPGQNGACVVVAEDGMTVLAVQEWRKAKIPPALTCLDGVSVIAIENQHVSGPHASLVLSAWCGWLCGTLPSEIPVLRPLATSWRAKVFGNGRLTRGPAKALAMAAAGPHLSGWYEGKMRDDLAEAWCIARYCAFYAKTHPDILGGK